MPKAELIKPFSIRTLGRDWKKGEPVEVDDRTAAILTSDPRYTKRFKVTGFDLNKVDLSSVIGKPSRLAELSDAIKEAADRLDPDTEGDYTEDGVPDHGKISDLLGYEVSAEEVALAFGLLDARQVKKAAPAKTARAKENGAEAKKANAGRVTISRTPKPAEADVPKDAAPGAAPAPSEAGVEV